MERRTSKLSTRNETPSWYIAKRVVRAHGLSYKELAQRLNLSATTVNNLMNHAPSIIHVKMLADAIGCSFFDFFDFSASPESMQTTLSAVSTTLAHRPTDNTFICPHCNQQFAFVPIEENREDQPE